ncbi:MAG: hypothetical protein ABIH52_02540 [Candidatus Aenigmatarchaeota archaeon]
MDGPGTNKIQRLISIFHEIIGRQFDVTSYKNRLLIQKITYILQIHDKSFGYTFNWFARGPYSPSLTRDEYSNGDIKNHVISKEDEENINFVRDLVGEINEKNLELLASVYYLITERKIENFNDLYFTLHSLKPWFEREEILKTFEKINSKLIKN